MLIIYAGHTQPDGNCWTIRVDVNSCPNNPVQKEGWNLILNENFNQPNKWEKRWHTGAWNDDGKDCIRLFGYIPENVTFDMYNSDFVDGGIPPSPYQQYIANIWNTNQIPVNYSSPCIYSAGEIKTMSTLDSLFKSYYFYGPAYIEAKVKLFEAYGQGAAMWLWNLQDSDGLGWNHNPQWDNQEIDVFETQSGCTSAYDATYHWTTAPPELNSEMEGHTIILQNHEYTSWTVFSIEWNSNMIQWKVNNTVVHTLWMSSGTGQGCPHQGTPYDPPLSPFCLRFWTGANRVGNSATVNPQALPQRMQIEYVRAYKKAGTKVSPIKFWRNINQICLGENSPSNSDNVISVNYYPDATFQWSSPAFDITPFQFNKSLPQHHNNKYKISCNSNASIGLAPIYLTTTFPWGYIEHDTAWMKILPDTPQTPGLTFISEFQSLNCKYHIDHPISDPSVIAAEWSCWMTSQFDNAIITFINGTPVWAKLDGNFEPNQCIPITYQDFNICGESPYVNAWIYIPDSPYPCYW